MRSKFNSPPFPSEDDVSSIADWAELFTMSSGRPLSRGLLRTTLSRESISAPDARNEETWLELGYRSKLFGNMWPLRLKNGILIVRRYDHGLILHFFLCALSLRYNIDHQGRRLFEQFVADVIPGLSGQFGLRLGFPRSGGMPKSFKDAISLYARLSAEGVGQPTYTTDKDLGLDVATWIGFEDRRGGYLHIIGQCATGSDWNEKLHDLDVKVLNEHISWAVEPVRFFATPYVVSNQRWRRACLSGGLLLDRPRLVELANASPLSRKRLGLVTAYCGSLYS